MLSKAEKRARIAAVLTAASSQNNMEAIGPEPEQSAHPDARCINDIGRISGETALSVRKVPHDCSVSSQSSRTSPSSGQVPQSSSKPTSLSSHSEENDKDYRSRNDSPDGISFYLPSYESSLHLTHEAKQFPGGPDAKESHQKEETDNQTGAEEECLIQGESLQVGSPSHQAIETQSPSMKTTSASPTKQVLFENTEKHVAFAPVEQNPSAKGSRSGSFGISQNDEEKHVLVPETPASQPDNDVPYEVCHERQKPYRPPTPFQPYEDSEPRSESLRSENVDDYSDEHDIHTSPIKQSSQQPSFGYTDVLQEGKEPTPDISFHPNDDSVEKPANLPASDPLYYIDNPFWPRGNDSRDMAPDNLEAPIASESPQTEVVPPPVNHPLRCPMYTMPENNDFADYQVGEDQGNLESSPLHSLEDEEVQAVPIRDSPDELYCLPLDDNDDYILSDDSPSHGPSQPKRLVAFPTLPPISPSPLAEFRYAQIPRLTIQDSQLSGRGGARKGGTGSRRRSSRAAPQILSMASNSHW